MYQSVGTPRFYVNAVEWAASNGIPIQGSELYPETNIVLNTLPVNPIDCNGFGLWGLQGMNEQSFVAVLGHNIATIQAQFRLITLKPDPSGFGATDSHIGYGDGDKLSSLVNCTIMNNIEIFPEFNGFTIATFVAPTNNLAFWLSDFCKIGSVVIGTYYDMPHSPDLKLSMEREMDGVKRLRTKGGNDLVDHTYTKSPPWGSAGAWELHGTTVSAQKLSRVGRRVWNLSFSQMQDSNVFPEVSSLITNEAHTHGLHGDNDYYWSYPMDYGLLRGNGLGNENFYAEVIHKTNGGQLPFIFQPDTNDVTDFAICKFDQSSFNFSQVANGVYNYKMKIREVW